MSKNKSQRNQAIDLLRGWIMVFMALDHASGMIARVHFFEIWGVDFEKYENGLWWFTRFISHLCAPGFFLLMGISMILFFQNRIHKEWSLLRIQKYFIYRGLFIIGLMFFLEFPAWGISNALSNVDSSLAMPGVFPNGFLIPSTVLFGLGSCMIIAAFLLRLPSLFLALISIVSFGFSTYYIGHADPDHAFSALFNFVFIPGMSVNSVVIYPIVPWIGVVTFGMMLAKLIINKGPQRNSILLTLGLWFLAIFVMTRAFTWGNFQMNLYDDWIGFMTLIKYPPSISFISATLGLLLILLYLFQRSPWNDRVSKLVRVFGQTAMFFYICHLYVYALIGALFPNGTSLYVLYISWLLGLIPIYFICSSFLKFKKSRPQNSIWRMF